MHERPAAIGAGNERRKMMEGRLIELETRVAHYEQMLDDLNNVIARQQNEIQELERQVGMILTHIRERTAQQSAEG